MKRSAHIRNPLSIIAIFAGIAEISGTIVLPLLHDAVQTTYVWFLMLFPSGLVLLFFGTLWKKAPVLYAPSDYANEDNFFRSIQPATAAEISKKQTQEISEAELIAEAAKSNEDQPAPTDSQKDFRDGNKTEDLDLRGEYLRTEQLAMNKLSQKYANLQKEVTLGSSKGRMVVDAISSDGQGGITIFEIKFIPKANPGLIRTFTTRFINALNKQGIKIDNKTKLNMVFVEKSESTPEKRLDIVNMALRNIDEQYKPHITIQFLNLDL